MARARLTPLNRTLHFESAILVTLSLSYLCWRNQEVVSAQQRSTSGLSDGRQQRPHSKRSLLTTANPPARDVYRAQQRYESCLERVSTYSRNADDTISELRTSRILSQSLSTLLAARPVGVLATRIHCKPSIATSLDNTIPKRSIT